MLKCWNLSSTQFVNAINKILNPARPQLDKLVWIVDLKAQFLTKSALQIQHPLNDSIDNSIP